MKRFIIALGLLLILYASACGSYINYGITDNIYLLGLIDIAIISSIMMIVPFILKLLGKLNNQNYKKICKYNSLIAFIISVLITTITNSSSFVGIGGLGALIYYYININIFGELNINLIEKKIQKEHDNKVTNTKLNFNVFRSTKILIIVIAILTIGIIVESIFIIKKLDYMDALIRRIKELENSYEYLSDDYWDERKENMVLKDKSDFMDEYIVFVLDGYGNYYYTYDCMMEVTKGKEYSFWAYNTNSAVSKGYKPFNCSN